MTIRNRLAWVSRTTIAYLNIIKIEIFRICIAKWFWYLEPMSAFYSDAFQWFARITIECWISSRCWNAGCWHWMLDAIELAIWNASKTFRINFSDCSPLMQQGRDICLHLVFPIHLSTVLEPNSVLMNWVGFFGRIRKVQMLLLNQ